MTTVHICCLIGTIISAFGVGYSANKESEDYFIAFFCLWLACVSGVFL